MQLSNEMGSAYPIATSMLSRSAKASARILNPVNPVRALLLLMMMLLNACATTRDDAQSTRKIKELTSYAQSLIGTPYKFGGNSPDTGFDCSGYVGHVFRKVTGLSLPHNTGQISRHGKPVRYSQLQEGDLVFYNTNHKPNSHVGIYLGNNRFIHAPSSGGQVRIEDMGLRYWETHFNGARRITF